MRYYRRNGNTTTIMDPADIESFHEQIPVTTREDEVRTERTSFENDVRGHRFHGLSYDGGIMSLCIIPRNPTQLPIFQDRTRIVQGFPPIYCTGWDIRFRQRAITLSGQFPAESAPHTVTEVNQLGSVLAAESFMLSRDGSRVRSHVSATDYFVPCIAFERELVTSAFKYLETLRQLEASPPWYIGVSLLNVRGFAMYVGPWRSTGLPQKLEDDDVITDFLLVEPGAKTASKEDVARLMRPCFDEIWRAFGFDRSLNFDKSGEWSPQ